MLARRLVEEAGVAAIAMHPRHASQQHRGRPDYALAREIAESLPVPFVLSGGLRPDAATVRAAFARVRRRPRSCSPAAASATRGCSPSCSASREREPTHAEVLEELHWLMDRVVEHMGTERAGRWLRKAYPWYVERLGGGPALQDALQRAEGVAAARAVLAGLAEPVAA